MNTAVSYENEVSQVVTTVFDSMLQLSVFPVSTETTFPWDIEGSVSYEGVWNGTMTLRCTRAQADDWTRRLMPVDNPQDEDVRDSMGELINMIGGNIKGILPPRNTLSVPSVSLTSSNVDHIDPETLNCKVVFEGETGPYTVILAHDRSR